MKVVENVRVWRLLSRVASWFAVRDRMDVVVEQSWMTCISEGLRAWGGACAGDACSKVCRRVSCVAVADISRALNDWLRTCKLYKTL